MAGRDVNFGLTPEQVKELTEAAARGATGPLTSAIVDLSKRLGITEDATKTLLRIVGEQDVPLERLSETLNRVANDYKRLREQAAALNPDNPTASARSTGQGRDRSRAFRARPRAAAPGDPGADRGRAAGVSNPRTSASSWGRANAGRGAIDRGGSRRRDDRRRYLEAAELFGQAADYVPSGHAHERSGYFLRQAALSIGRETSAGITTHCAARSRSSDARWRNRRASACRSTGR